ncbi:MAG: neutral/alkaline non-lysosomal ceramidase N-terminal domain-containing protein [Bryobacterales bacterium]|nr:neutral/alkaline non-lysosomal ceramidase N-terminal domain-containing protein [Bryobacteraceae bacterium]MDW8130088.1 neutral/alkaline non-lysosomal ceramidase N-terminal domain-containing protein [Bryobacterales bacterium]
MKFARCIALALLTGAAAPAGPADFRAGIGRVKITPQEPIWLSGYAARTRPSEGAVHDLWVRALALEDSRGGRLVFIGADLIALPRAITDPVAARLQKQYGLDRARVVFTATHTHAGPVVRSNLTAMYDLDAENTRRIQRYGDLVTQALFDAAAAALGDLKPARVWFGTGRAAFAINRREPTAKGIRIGVNPAGPTDHEVPVIKVAGPDGSLRAVLFAYACHNTTLGQDFYQISGDYAGFAQLALENKHPGAVAIFYTLCAGDQNPHPRGKLELARQHGEALAAEVERVLSEPMRPLAGPIRAAFLVTELRFAHHTREMFEQRLNDANPHRARHARLMLKAYQEQQPIRTAPYPVQAIRFGRSLTLLALAGEVVVDYQIRLKKEYGGREPLIVAAFANDVAFYVPSLRVLKEGGYEAADSMIFYGMPGPFDDDIEQRVLAAVRQVMKRVGR